MRSVNPGVPVHKVGDMARDESKKFEVAPKSMSGRYRVSRDQESKRDKKRNL